MDEIMRGLQGSSKKTVLMRLGVLPIVAGVAGAFGVKHAVGWDGHIGRRTMAKIIEFYIPSTFRKSGKWVPSKDRGKVIEFVSETKKMA